MEQYRIVDGYKLLFNKRGISKVSKNMLRAQDKDYCSGNGGHVTHYRSFYYGQSRCINCQNRATTERLKQKRASNPLLTLTPTQQYFLKRLETPIAADYFTPQEMLSIKALERKGLIEEKDGFWCLVLFADGDF